jgi:predicted nucleotidyltransferase
MLHSDYLVDKEAVGSALALRKPFQALDKVTLIKIDFYIAEKIPGELTRSAEHELFPGIKIPLVSLEDSILSKLLWVKEGSEKAKRDIVAMLSANSEIDWPYLKQMAEKLELSTILASLASQYNC